MAQSLDLGVWRYPDELTRLNEKSLVLSAQGGDARAFEFIYRRYSPLVYSICLRMLRVPHDAQEATQETFLRVFRALPEFNGSYRLRPWISRIARNICLDKARFTTKRTNVSESVNPFVQESTPDPSTEPERVLMRKFEGSQLRARLDDLPTQYKSVLLLRDLDGLSYADIADKLSISEGQVKNFLHRGRKKLRRSLVVNRIALLAPIGFLKLRWYKLLHAQSVTRATAPQEVPSSSLMGAVTSSTPQLASASQAIVAASQPAGERIVAAVGAAVVGFGIAGAPATGPALKLERPAVHRVVDAAPSVPGHSERPAALREYFDPPVPDQSRNEVELESQESTTEPVAAEEEVVSIPDEEVPAPEEETSAETLSEPIDAEAEVPAETPSEVPSDEGDAPATGEAPTTGDASTDAPPAGEPAEVPSDEGEAPTTGDASTDAPPAGEPAEVPSDEGEAPATGEAPTTGDASTDAPPAGEPAEVPSDEGEAPTTGDASTDAPPAGEPAEVPSDEGEAPTTGDASTDAPPAGETPAETGSEQPAEAPADDAVTNDAPDAPEAAGGGI